MLLLTFNAGVNRYAIDSTQVVELIPKVNLRPIPHAPPFLVGLLAYRGKVVPVVDLGLLLANTACRESLSTRIILVKNPPGDQNRWKDDRDRSVKSSQPGPWNQKHDPDLLGLVGEQVSDLTSIEPSQIVPAPVHIPAVPYLDAIVQTDQGIVQLIAVDRLRDVLFPGTPTGLEKAAAPESSKQESPESKSEVPESGSS